MQLYAGEAFVFRFTGEAGEDFSTLPVKLVLNHKNGTRLELRHLDGGSDATVESATSLVFSKPPSWTAANLDEGVWQLLVCVGAAASDQDAVIVENLVVLMPINGPLPTS